MNSLPVNDDRVASAAPQKRRNMLTLVMVPVMVFAANGFSASLEPCELKGIVADNPTGKIESRAIREMRDTMGKLYNIKLPLLEAEKKEPVIYLGQKACVASGLTTTEDLSSVTPGGYVVKSGPQGVAIAGEDCYDTLFGCYAFFETLGVKYYQWNKPTMPEPPPHRLDFFELKEKPFMRYRNGYRLQWRQMFQEVGDPRKGLNPELFGKKSGSDLWMDHTAGYLVPKRLYRDEHPEYYAMLQTGERIAKKNFTDHRTPLCVSNPDVAEISIRRMLGWIDKNPEKRFFPATYGDTGFWCHCPRCRALDPTDSVHTSRLTKNTSPSSRVYAARLLFWVNQIAKAVKVRYPEKEIVTFAYGGTDKAPASARPVDNVWIVCATGLGNLPFYDHVEKTEQKNKLSDWLRIADNVMVCEYLSGNYLPAPLESTVARVKDYGAMGIKGIFFTYGDPINFRPVWQYLFPKICWNPNVNLDGALAEFAEYHYQAAADDVSRIFTLYRRNYLKTLEEKQPIVKMYPKRFYSASFVESVLDAFHSAEEKVGNDNESRDELLMEEYLFLKDALSHLPDYDFTNANTQRITTLLTRMKDVSTSRDRLGNFIKDVNRFGANLKKRDPRYERFLERWLEDGQEFSPVERDGAIMFTPDNFFDADFGPDIFADQAHPKFIPPPKYCVGVKSHLKNVTRGCVWSCFTLNDAPSGTAVLEMEGQDAVTKWAAKKHLHKTIETMIIKINGDVIYEGEAGFVRGNWSRRSFEFDSGILKKGKNKLEICNLTKNSWPHCVALLLIANAEMKFPSEDQ